VTWPGVGLRLRVRQVFEEVCGIARVGGDQISQVGLRPASPELRRYSPGETQKSEKTRSVVRWDCDSCMSGSLANSAASGR